MEIQLYDKLQSANEIESLGMKLGKCGFGNNQQEYGIAILLDCQKERISPVDWTRRYDFVSGKVRKKAVAAFADFRKLGGKVRWIKSGDDGVEACAEFEFENQKITLSYTIDQAKRQGLVRKDSNWEKTPGNMLRSRLLSNAISMLAPEIYAGGETDDGDNDSPAPLLQPQPQQQAPIDIPVTVVTTEPVKEEVPQPQPDPQPVATDGKLSVETVLKLQEIIGDANAEKAIEFLKAKGKIQSNLTELPLDWAQRIIGNPQGFLTAIGA